MEKLFNIINIGYMTNSNEVKVPFKKQYISILEKLMKLNCINSFTFSGNFILVKLRYYRNKPLFFLKIKSKRNNKIYKNFIENTKMFQRTSTLSLFLTDKGLMSLQEVIFFKIGGKHIADILFFDKK